MALQRRPQLMDLRPRRFEFGDSAVGSPADSIKLAGSLPLLQTLGGQLGTSLEPEASFSLQRLLERRDAGLQPGDLLVGEHEALRRIRMLLQRLCA